MALGLFSCSVFAIVFCTLARFSQGKLVCKSFLHSYLANINEIDCMIKYNVMFAMIM